MKQHFIFDYETLSQNPIKCVIINSSYYTFDYDRFISNNPYTFSELTESIICDKLNIEQQKKDGREIQKDTVDFWAKQSKEARKQLIPSDKDVSIKQHLKNIKNYLYESGKISRWWSRGNTFDPIILQMIDEEYQTEILKKKLFFWNVRDIRTHLDSKFNFETKTNFCPFTDEEKWKEVFIPHVSVHDVAADIMRFQSIARAENNLEIINE